MGFVRLSGKYWGLFFLNPPKITAVEGTNNYPSTSEPNFVIFVKVSQNITNIYGCDVSPPGGKYRNSTLSALLPP